MDRNKHMQFIHNLWDQSIVPTLEEYIRIPNKSPLFDPHWQQHGFMDKAVELIATWCKQQAVPNMQLDVIREGNRTPIILITIPGSSDDTVLLYGHLDKQPEMTGWDPDLGPWTPVIKNERLYGRGGADDGYAAFASLAAIKSLQEQQIPHARCVILIEAGEESGSPDLPYYIEALKDRIGKPSLIICLDSGCGNYEQMWVTTSLRGLIGGTLSIDVLNCGIHSGGGSGIVPSCFMVLRQLMNRIEDDKNAKVHLTELWVDVPEQRKQQIAYTAKVLGNHIHEDLPFQSGVKPITDDLTELLLNQTWRPALSVTGCDGLPATANAGNVTLPSLKVKLSIRIPPTCDATIAMAALKKTLESNPPFGAKIHFAASEAATGWNAPLESPWLVQAINEASCNYFGENAVYVGEGWSIPFMGMLGKKFPDAQFLITGVLGPGANAHGPNEFLHIPTGKKLTCAVSEVIAKHYLRVAHSSEK